MSDDRECGEGPAPQEAEPIDADFTPAEEAAASDPKRPRSWGLGALGLFLLSASAGGVLGVAGVRVLDQAERAAVAPAPAALEARLADLETRLDGLAQGPQAQEVLTDLEARITALEARPAPAAAAGLADLRARIEALEAAPAPAPEDALTARIAEMETALEALNRQVTAINEAATAASAGSAGADAADAQALAGLATQVETLRAALDDLAGQAEARALDLAGRLDQQDQAVQTARRLAADAQAAAEAAESAAQSAAQTAQTAQAAADRTGAEALQRFGARALALSALEQAARGAGPFPLEHDALARLWPDQPDLAALGPLARSGAPDRRTLAETFPTDAIQRASGEARAILGLIRVETIDPETEGETPAALAARAQTALAEGDLAAALAAVEALEGEAAAAARDWLFAARARLEIETRLTAVRAALLDGLEAEAGQVQGALDAGQAAIP